VDVAVDSVQVQVVGQLAGVPMQEQLVLLQGVLFGVLGGFDQQRLG